MERAFDEYVKDVDERIESVFVKNISDKIKTFENASYSINQILNNPHWNLPSKWHADLLKHAEKKVCLIIEEYYINEFYKDIKNVVASKYSNTNFKERQIVIGNRVMLSHLMKEVENLKSSNLLLIEKVETLESSNNVLKTELNTLKTAQKYTSDPRVPVGIIQRYWRSYVLRRNVKILAKQYEENMLKEFRKNLVKGVTPNKVHEGTKPISYEFLKDILQSKVCEAAESRKVANTLPKKLKPGPSDPREWTERKATQVARDWMN